MNVQQIRTRGFLFTFDDIENILTNVYVIKGKNHYFICDTYLGPDPMEEIKEYLFSTQGKLPFIVFNSHYHWDHIWGNCAFENDIIVGHVSIINLINLYGESELFSQRKYKKGDVKIVPPNLVFKYFLAFPNEKITLFKSPGHTFDSASLYDILDKVLYVGDTIEDPIPSVENKEFEEYIRTIERYENLDYKVLIPGHMTKDGLPKKRILQKNVKYLQALMEKKGLTTFLRKKYRHIHKQNLENLEKIGYIPLDE